MDKSKQSQRSAYATRAQRNQRQYQKRNQSLAMIPRQIRGTGGYYVQGGLFGSAKMGPYKANAGIQGGYYRGDLPTRVPAMTGLGAYNISNIRHNVLIKPDIPQVRNALYAEGATVIRHREYLGPIITSDTAGAFKLQSFPLNPAQATTFPWLSTIASNYEEYKPNGLMFEFRSTASDAIASSTNLALGQCMMVSQYDPTDPLFSNDVELLNYTWAQSGKVSDNIQHYVECDPKQSPLSHLYTREGGTSNSSDLRFSDFGRFSIATSGLQGESVQIGQLWVTYEFLLYKPKVGSSQADAGGWFHFHSDVGVSDTNPLGTTPMSSGEFDAVNNLDITLADNVSDGDIIFPPQFKPASFMVVYSIIGSSAANVTAANFSQTTDPAIQFVEHYFNNALAIIQSPAVGTTADRSVVVTWITIDGDGESHTLKLRNSYTPGSGIDRSVDLYIAQIAYLNPLIY